MMPDIKFYLSIFLRRLPYFTVAAVLVTAIGLTIASILPAKYQAEALLLVEGEQIPGSLAASTVLTAAPEQLQIIERRLMTRANILDISQRLGLFPANSELNATEKVAEIRARTTIRLQGGRGNATTVKVAFESENPGETARVTNEFVTLILAENVELRSDRATQTMEFFQQETERLGLELGRINSEILTFKMDNQNALPDSLDYRRTRQTSLQERLLQLQREEANLADRRAKFVELFESTGRVNVGQAAQSPAQLRLEQVQSDLNQALTIYAPSNPRIKLLEARVKALEAEVAGQTVNSDAQEGDAALSLFELQLSDVDGQLEFLAEQRQLVEAELEELTTSIEATPQNSIRLSEFQRDFDNVQRQYNQAIQSLSAAQTGERIEVLSKGQRISVLERAVIPSEPFSPNRQAIAMASVGGGLLAGLGLVILLEFLNQSIRRPNDIANKLGFSPIATLPYVLTRKHLFWRRFLIISALVIVGVGIPVTLWALHTYYLPMDILIEKVLDKSGVSEILDKLNIGQGQ